MKCGIKADDRRLPNNCNGAKGQKHEWRDNDIPFIIDNGKSLTEITGWFRNSNGQLVSQKNKIPQPIDTGYGEKPYYDLIKNIRLFSIIFKEIEYTLLSISWEWTKAQLTDREDAFIFTGNKALVVDLKPNVKTRIDLNFYTKTGLGGTQTMQDAITFALNNPTSYPTGGVGSDLSYYGQIGHNGKKEVIMPPLELYIYFDQEKKAIRFLFQFSEKYGHETSPFAEELPDDFYFETSYDNFSQIFSIKR